MPCPPAMLCIAVLFMVAKGIETSGGLEYVSKALFSTKNSVEKHNAFPGRSTANSIVWVILRFAVPVAIFSA